jgi:hypothetical protein
MARLRTYGPLAIFVAVPALLVLSAVGPGQFLYGSDVIGGFYHLRGAVGRALAEGRLPVWDPHVMAGFPLLAAMQGAVFYPLSWFCVFLSPGVFWTTSALIHMTLAGAFAHRWLERGLGLDWRAALGGAVLFMMSSYLVSHIHAGHMNYVWAYPWLPAVLWRLERLLAGLTVKRGVLLAVVVATLFFCGVPQIFLFAGTLMAARGVQFVLKEREGRKERARQVAGAAAWLALGAALCAPQLLPTMELIGQGQRSTISNYEFVTSYSVAPGNFLTLLAPTFFGDGRDVKVWSHGFIWESPAFVGIAGLGLAALGVAGRHPQRFLWAGVAVLAVLLSMGQYSPVFKFFYHVVPGVGLFRAPSRYLVLFTLAASALAAMGLQRLLTGDERLRRDARGVSAAAALVMVAAVGFRLSLDEGTRWWSSLVEHERAAVKTEQKIDPPSESREASAKSLLWAALCAAAVGGSLLARPVGAAAALGLLLAGELGVLSARYFVGHPLEGVEWAPQFVANVKSHPRHPFRIATVAAEQTPAIGKCQLAGLDHVGGYEPMMLRRYTELVNVARGKPASDLIVAMVLARPGPLFDLLGARYWLVPGPRVEPPGWRTVGQLPNEFVYENPKALPRAFLVGRSVNIGSDADRLKFMTSPGFDALQVVVTERDSGGLADGDAQGGAVRLESMSPGLYALQTECPGDAYLVLAESWYPGWRVEVDGAPAELLRANHLFQAVRVPAGKHAVRFTYKPRLLGIGFALAAAGIGVPLGLLLWRRRRT